LLNDASDGIYRARLTFGSSIEGQEGGREIWTNLTPLWITRLKRLRRRRRVPDFQSLGERDKSGESILDKNGVEGRGRKEEGGRRKEEKDL
jgi:hypothetical protein